MASSGPRGSGQQPSEELARRIAGFLFNGDNGHRIYFYGHNLGWRSFDETVEIIAALIRGEEPRP